MYMSVTVFTQWHQSLVVDFVRTMILKYLVFDPLKGKSLMTPDYYSQYFFCSFKYQIAFEYLHATGSNMM